MIVADSSVVIDYLAGKRAPKTDVLDEMLAQGLVGLAPAIVAELFSDPLARQNVEAFIQATKILPITEGYWKRAGTLRAKVRKSGFKANLGDALIAQSCIDHDVPLLTSDKDFRHYAKAAGLKFAAPNT